MIKSLSIKNFRGIEEVSQLAFGNFNLFIGDNGTSKTTLLDAIHYSFSPSFLSSRIKHTDFFNGGDSQIGVTTEFRESISVGLPDGYTEQQIKCDKVSLTIKKRDKKTAGKIFSDLVTIEHILLPNFKKSEKGWSLKRQTGTTFYFTERSLSLSQVSAEELPRSFLFGKERDRQLQKGYNSSFSTIIEDLNWRFARSIRAESDEKDTGTSLMEKLKLLTEEVEGKVEFDKYEVFKEFRKRTDSFIKEEIRIAILDSIAPFESAFLSTSVDILDLPVKMLGSGIEMIVSILFLETLASLSKEKLIILIDEPELHLHPKLQEKLSEYLCKISSGDIGHQVFVTTHSPIFFKHCIGGSGVKSFVTKKEKNKIAIEEITLGKGLFPWSPSWGEINYFAYEYLTIEFHDELYGYIQEKASVYAEKDVDQLLTTEGLHKAKKWKRESGGKVVAEYDVTLSVFIRNKVHHPENKSMASETFTNDDLRQSTEQMIRVVKNLNTKT